MSEEQKKTILQNLLFAAIVMLFGLVLLLLQQLLGGLEVKREKAFLIASMNAREPGLATSPLPSASPRIYSWGRGQGLQYGVLLPVGSPGYSALIGLVLSQEGRIDALRLVSSSSGARIARDEGFLAAFLGSSLGTQTETSLEVHLNPGAEGPDALFLLDFQAGLRELGVRIGALQAGRTR